jgi:prepilin-type N-terminal cleavage/methylation domain-containing protein
MRVLRRHTARPRTARRGFSYLELLMAVVLLSMAAAGAVATWSFSTRAARSKRITETGVYVGVHAVERVKSRKYLGVDDTGAEGVVGSTPLEYWYDRYGQPVNAAATEGYRARVWLISFVDRDTINNSEDLRRVTAVVTNNAGTDEYDRIDTLLSMGGL